MIEFIKSHWGWGIVVSIGIFIFWVIFFNGSSYTEYNDYDCSDFYTQKEAQTFFYTEGTTQKYRKDLLSRIENGEITIKNAKIESAKNTKDYHNLDRDGDGIACESLP